MLYSRQVIDDDDILTQKVAKTTCKILKISVHVSADFEIWKVSRNAAPKSEGKQSLEAKIIKMS